MRGTEGWWYLRGGPGRKVWDFLMKLYLSRGVVVELPGVRVSNARMRSKRASLSRVNMARPGGDRRFHILPIGARRGRWRKSRGCALHALIPFLHSNPSPTFEINNISKGYCSSWRSGGSRGTGVVLRTRGTAPAQGPLCLR